MVGSVGALWRGARSLSKGLSGVAEVDSGRKLTKFTPKAGFFRFFALARPVGLRPTALPGARVIRGAVIGETRCRSFWAFLIDPVDGGCGKSYKSDDPQGGEIALAR